MFVVTLWGFSTPQEGREPKARQRTGGARRVATAKGNPLAEICLERVLNIGQLTPFLWYRVAVGQGDVRRLPVGLKAQKRPNSTPRI